MGNKIDSEIEALRKNGKRHFFILDTISYGIQENDCEGTITYSNRAHHELLGYENGQLPGKKIWDLVASNTERERLKNDLSSIITEQPEPITCIVRNVKKDGTPVDLKIDWDYERNDDGVVTGLVSVITDVKKQKTLDEYIDNRSQGLTSLFEICKRLSETLALQDVLQASVESVTNLVGLDTAAVYLLEGDMLRLWATSPPLPEKFPDEMRNAPLIDHPHIQRAITSAETIYINDYLTTNLTPAEKAIIEKRGLRTLLFVPLLLDDKALGIFIVGSIGQTSVLSKIDTELAFTMASLASLAIKNAQLFEESEKNTAELEKMLADRIRMEDEKHNLENQLQHAQRMDSIGRLAGGVAHDFNNMLGVILGYSELCLEQIDVNDPIHKILTEIHKAGQRSAALTRQLLAFARKQQINPVVLNLNDVIEEMLKMLRRLIGENIDLVWLPGENLGLVKIDPAQVDQIMVNLCVNARDAISEVGKITIETSNEEFDAEYCLLHPEFSEGKYICIAVSDNGMGMDPKILPNIFEPYFSTKTIDKGNGLGLSTVYGIVRQNKGFISVYSEEGHGTIFRIYLSKNEAASSPHRIKTENQTLRRSGSETILLVEDDHMVLELGKKMLNYLGYKVLTAGNPMDALRTARQYKDKINLLVTDVVMPDMNGFDLADQLETIIPGIKVLYTSGFTANAIKQRNLCNDGVLLLSKPFSLSELATKVCEAIDLEKSD